MKDDHLESLMQLVLDGEATAEERAMLDRALADDPSQIARYDELKSVFSALASVQMVEPPADLAEETERLLGDEAQNPSAAGEIHLAEPAEPAGIFDALLGVFRLRPGRAFVFSLASGAALGAIVVAAFMGLLGAGTGDSRLAAQMASPSQATLQAIDQKTLEMGTSKIAVTTRLGASAVEAALEVSSVDPIEIEVAFDPDGQPLHGIALEGPGVAGLQRGPGNIAIHNQGAARYVLRFAHGAGAGQSIRVTLESNGVLKQEVIRSSPGGR